MASFFSFSLQILSLSLFFTTIASSETLGLDFYHRFSDEVKQWEKSHNIPSTWNSDEVPRGTVEYYNMLLRHDLSRHKRRSLAEGDQYSFTIEGNQTTRFYDALHYAYVALGTPSQTFFVLLDTGSHLFWLPCNCQQCAPNSSPEYGNMEFSSYMPNASLTSKTIMCGDQKCDRRFRNICLNKSSDCSYSIQYVSPGSTSGVLMEDILLFENEQNINEKLQLPIVFGCGEVQDGDLLDHVPNGIMGLGLDSLSVPTMLAKNTSIYDSFSMCFRNDSDSGTLRFGDKGKTGQYETPLIIQKGNPYYNINITAIVVGNRTMKEEFTVIVDSGTNYGLLEDPFYTLLGSSFSAQVKDKRVTFSNIPLDYCFKSSNENPPNPKVSFTAKGGIPFPITEPIVFLVDKNGNQVGYCLAMFKTTDGNVIGDIFMTGLNVVFNREKLVLGWQETDCDSAIKTEYSYADAPSSMSPPKKSWGQSVKPYTLLNTLIILSQMFFAIVLFH